MTKENPNKESAAQVTSSAPAKVDVVSNKAGDGEKLLPKEYESSKGNQGNKNATNASGAGAKPEKTFLQKYTPAHPTNVKRVKFGKANIKRDCFFFFAAMGFLFFISFEMSGTGDVDPKKKKSNTLSELKRMRMYLAKHLKERSINRVERYDCNLFLARSSIPGSGLGIFAGKNFSQGEFLVRL
jgi:hypothetical protein